MSASGGAESSLAAVAPFLVDAGVEIHLAVLTEDQDLVPTVRSSGVAVHDLSGRNAAGRTLALSRLVRRLRPDLIHATLLQAALPAQAVGPIHRVPVLVTWANTAVDPAADPAANWKLAVVRAADTVAAGVSRSRFHAVTAGVERSKCAELHVASRRVRVAERGRDPEAFRRSDPTTRSRIRKELGIEETQIVYLAVGRQEPQKGYVDLLRAFDQVAAKLAARLLIAGRPGAATPAIEAAHKEIQSGASVDLLGQRDDVADLLAAADVVVCASHREGAAGALIEAMAVGAAILSVEVEGLADVLHDGVNSRVVQRSQLGEAMLQLGADPGARVALAEGGRRTFEDRFTIERSATSLLEVYRWAMRRA